MNSRTYAKLRRSYIEVRAREFSLTTTTVLADREPSGVFKRSTPRNQLAKGIIAVMKRLIVLIAIAALSTTAVYSQGPATDAPRQVKAGEVIQLGGAINLRVTKSAKSPFTGVKMQGAPLVVVLEFDGGKQGATLSYKLTPDAKSDLYLMSGAQKLAPLAVIEDFPAWGADNDKEIEVLSPKESVGSVTLSFGQKGTVSLLFDVSAEQAKTPQRFSLMLHTIKPNNEKYSLVVNL